MDLTERRTTTLPGRLAAVWVIVGVAAFTLGLFLAWDPSFATLAAAWWTLLPFLVLTAMTSALADPVLGLSPPTKVGAVAVTLAGWTALVFHDDRWSVLTFALYAMCFLLNRTIGIALAAVVSAVWTAAWIDASEPGWRLLIPLAAFTVGAIISVTTHQVGDENRAQAALIAQLEATQRDLAASERERGVMEERARFAGEIHDTLAQGFTSIVLVSRATRRNEEWLVGLASIEATAEDSLQAARRLVAAVRPPELDGASLPDALTRHVAGLRSREVSIELEICGMPFPLAGATEVALFRAAQEALLNVRTHAGADEVHVTLSYVGDSVALDVADNGVGFDPGTTTDRGALTGGQGLEALRFRAESLGGHLSLETRPGGGSVVSVQVPGGGR